ncbi:MAG: BTAD domain-containing putative transcriptional regulator [Actinophytocola sp.]|uniref:AfsR/SARP family transcriptional regulator n=1 Tax=Actinophytocola sp. TaxID=1872138 RepID=UPI003C719091
MWVEFGLLGETTATIEGREVLLGPARQRCVLAALLMDAGRAVPPDRLVYRVWGDHAPYSVAGTLRVYLSRLRDVFKGTGVEIDRTSSGYVLRAEYATIDIQDFRALVERGRASADDQAASELFGQALRLWRGEAFEGLHSDWLDELRTLLEAERLSASLDRYDIELRLGRHAAVLPSLAADSAAYPLDERLTRQLMLAQHRSGRQADALLTYTRISRQLRDELGSDPGPPLRKLHQRILDNGRAPAGTQETGGAPVPRQLPPPPGHFTGRAAELARLDTAFDTGSGSPGNSVAIFKIVGAGGIGKTALALRWAHRNAQRFPDGQLYVNLRGFDPAEAPMPATAALRGFLAALGMTPTAIPVEPDTQTGLYRSLMAGKRMLVLLDNAHNTEQVAPLLPGDPSCTVLVTSRQRLSTLVTSHAARAIDLDVLSRAEAVTLLTGNLGHDRIAAEPDAVAALLDRCAGLPLALGIIAARAGAHPGFPLRALAGELDAASTRLNALDAGELATNLRAVFTSSYRALDGPTAEVFGLLGLAPGSDISLPAAAVLIAAPAGAAAMLLRNLENANLVQQYQPGRYRMHDLVRLYAAEQALRLPEADQDGALRRVISFYLHTAFAAEQLLNPRSRPVQLDPLPPGCHPQPLSDPASAIAWFDAEHANLMATQRAAVTHGWHQAVWQVAWTVHTFHHHRRELLPDQLTAWSAAVHAAEALEDAATQTIAHIMLGRSQAVSDQHSAALDHLHRARTMAEERGSLADQAHAHRILAWVWGRRGDDERSLEHASHALRAYQATESPDWEASALSEMGWCTARLGKYDEAREFGEAALALHRQHRSRDGEAYTLDSLGYIAYHAGDHDRAIDLFRQALALFRDLGNAHEEADTLGWLGHPYLALGQHERAGDAWRAALTLYRAQHRASDADRVQRDLADLADLAEG